MNYLFIYHSPDVLGGIETLIGRMSGWLTRNGHQVTLLTTSSDKWKQVLPEGVRCVALKRRFRDLFYPVHARRLWRELGIPAPDVIKTFDLPTSWVGCIISDLLPKPAKVVAASYNPHVFDFKRGGQTLMDGWPLYLKNFLRNIPGDARVVCDPQEAKEFQQVHGAHQQIIFWPLPVDGERFREMKRTPKPGRIVSIGRLAPMKEYNLYLVGIVARLRAAGLAVDWQVYGSGPYESRMRELIRQHQMEEHIKLHGDIDYRRLEDALREACVFVGMGTAILEASFARVPSVPASAYEPDGLTYGPIDTLPFGTIGQIKDDEPPRLHVYDELVRILNLSETEYWAEADRILDKVQGYSLDRRMQEFQTIVEKAGYPRRNRSLYHQNYLYALGRCVGIRLDDWAGMGGGRSELKMAGPAAV